MPRLWFTILSTLVLAACGAPAPSGVITVALEDCEAPVFSIADNKDLPSAFDVEGTSMDDAAWQIETSGVPEVDGALVGISFPLTYGDVGDAVEIQAPAVLVDGMTYTFSGCLGDLNDKGCVSTPDWSGSFDYACPDPPA